MIRVALADDSTFIRKALVRILDADSRIEVVGTATCGEELLDHLEDWQPDVVSLDLSMPGIGGLRTLDEIMSKRPTPVIILSTHAREDAPLTIEALHRGAVDFIDKQRYSLVDFQSLSKILIDRIVEIADPKNGFEPAITLAEPVADAATAREDPQTNGAHELLVVAASTGGPMAIQRVLEAIGEEPPVPVVLVQHMPPDFTAAFADRLNSQMPFAVRHTADGDLLLPGTAYVAPGGYQLQFERRTQGLTAVLSDGPERTAHRPSADITFSSAADVSRHRTLAVILTGMGSDGADGLAALSRAGSHTIAQDRSSSVVFGMPRAAIERGAIAEILSLDNIGTRVKTLLDKPSE